MKELLNELSKKSSNEITDEAAKLINKYLADHAFVRVQADTGDTKLQVSLSGDELKYLMLKLYEQWS